MQLFAEMVRLQEAGDLPVATVIQEYRTEQRLLGLNGIGKCGPDRRNCIHDCLLVQQCFVGTF